MSRCRLRKNQAQQAAPLQATMGMQCFQRQWAQDSRDIAPLAVCWSSCVHGAATPDFVQCRADSIHSNQPGSPICDGKLSIKLCMTLVRNVHAGQIPYIQTNQDLRSVIANNPFRTPEILAQNEEVRVQAMRRSMRGAIVLGVDGKVWIDLVQALAAGPCTAAVYRIAAINVHGSLAFPVAA